MKEGRVNSDEARLSRLVKVAPVVRGMLATPSGDDDRPWRRVILQSLAEGAERRESQPAPLRLDALDPETAPEMLRERIAAALANRRPEAILWPGAGTFRVLTDAPDPHRPLENETALVTGAAGAIGAAICRELLAWGCRVAATDLPGERLDRFAAEFEKAAPGRAIGVPLDVTDERSVKSGFDRVTLEWGGVDIAIANAGIPLIASLVEMRLEDFRRLERVNVEGTLLTLAEAGRRMRLQGTGGDIVLISTKNVFSPGARFGAYSATKAAAHQLARIASLEMAEFGVRVNMVAPDAVFGEADRKSGLWEAIGPDRMRDKGIDEKGLQEYYRKRNLLKTRVTAQHVANAVMFLVARRTPTTGATIPVDGGLPDATPR
jgi:NAD(P)-dependent dehydrogenase (short-subunit alcohol dehydrogenase family)